MYALRGAYVIRKSEKKEPDVILMATGSEVELIYEASKILKKRGIDVGVISMAFWEVFEKQDEEYKQCIT